MNPADLSLLRLFQAASQAPPEGVADPPIGLETRVLVQWRLGIADVESAFLFAFFRRAMLCAAVIFLFSAAWSLTRMAHDMTAEEAILDNYDVQLSLNP